MAGKITNGDMEKALADLKRATGICLCLEPGQEKDWETLQRIRELTSAYRVKHNKSSFLEQLMRGQLTGSSLYEMAKKYHVAKDAKRAVFVIRVAGGESQTVWMLLKTMFPSGKIQEVLQSEEDSLVLIKEVEDGTEDALEQIGETIVDMLSTEALCSRVRVTFGHVATELAGLSKSYEEAQLAMKIGLIFHMEQRVIPYTRMGMGRLIYQLPEDLCRSFLQETFGERKPATFDEETTITIQRFFENNLNISETARQLFLHRNTLVYRLERLQRETGLDIRVFEEAMTLKIALMIMDYLRTGE